MTSRSLGHRAPLLWLALPLMVGLAAGKAGEVTLPLRLLVLAFGVALVSLVLNRRPAWWATSLVVALSLTGVGSYALHRQLLPSWENRPAREAEVSLRIVRMFPAREAGKVSGLAIIVRGETHLAELREQRVYFSLALRRGEQPPLPTLELKVRGVIEALPRNPPVNSFDGYLANAGINFRLHRGRVLATEQPATALARFHAAAAARFKRILALGIGTKRPELTALLRGMMLGETHELDDEQLALFRQSGTMHLFAISGLNIAVIAGALQIALLLPLRRWPLVQFACGIGLLWLFVAITGAAPSAVRAFSMAVFLQAAFTWWKPGNVLASLVASATVVLVVAPLQFFSASFVMSYGIVAALLLLGLPLGEAWTAWWSPGVALPRATWRWWHHTQAAAWRWLASALAVGLATTLVGALMGIYYFGLLTPSALLVNLALIPAAGCVTLCGFASLIFGLFGVESLASFCNHAAALVLWGIEQTVRLSAAVPGSSLPAQFKEGWPGGGVLLALLGGGLLVGYALGWRKHAGGFWAPFVFVAAVLAFGVARS